MTLVSIAGVVDCACQEPQHKKQREACNDEAGDLLCDMHGFAPSYPLSGLESEASGTGARPEREPLL
jgi:hypothetical protein